MSDPDRTPDRCAGPLGDLLGGDPWSELYELEAVIADVEDTQVGDHPGHDAAAGQR